MRLCCLGLCIACAIGSTVLAQPAAPTADAGSADAQRPDSSSPPEVHYGALKSRIWDQTKNAITIEERRRLGKGLLFDSLDAAPSNAAVRTQALDPVVSVGPPGRITAGIKTDLDDVEGGATIAPGLLLSASHWFWRGWTVSMASLEDSKSRVGAGWSYEFSRKLLTPESVGVKPCKNDLEAFGRQLDSLAGDFETVCERLVKVVPDPSLAPLQGEKPEVVAKQAGYWHAAQIACGYERPTPASDPGLSEAIAEIKTVVDYATAKVRDRKVIEAQRTVKYEYDTLVAFRGLDPTACYESKELGTAYTRTAWSTTRKRLGASANADFFQRVYGFKPDPEAALPRGEAQEWKVRAGVARSVDGSQQGVTLGYGQARVEPRDELRGIVTVGASLSGFAHGIAADLYDEDGKLNVNDDGELPAYLTVGVEVTVDFATNPPDTQSTRANIQKFEGTAFIDFHVRKDLGFRLGLPLKAEIAKRDADDMAMPPLVEKRDLQWTLYPFVSTVLKL